MPHQTIERDGITVRVYRYGFRPGFYADLAVLDADPTELLADMIRGVNVTMTIAGGRIVHGG